MTLLRQRPLGEFGLLQREMNRLFDSLSPFREAEVDFGRFMPAAEMTETDEAIDLKVELPGLKAEDVDIQVAADAVIISGERKSENQIEENGLTRSEFHYGSFRRVVPLNTRVDNSQATADYQDGILKLHLPKAADERHKIVKVAVN